MTNEKRKILKWNITIRVPDNYGTVRSGAGSVDGFYSI